MPGRVWPAGLGLALALLAPLALAQGWGALSPEDRALIDGILGGAPLPAGPPAGDGTAGAAGRGDGGLAAARATLEAVLETGRPGVAERWEDPASGDYGLIVPEFDYRTDAGIICRDYLRTLVRGEHRLGFSGTACRVGPRQWEVVGEALVDEPDGPAAPPAPAAVAPVDLREVQTLLAALGLDPGPIDGIAGARTAAAIRAFQEREGLEPDGQASADLVERLRLARLAQHMAELRRDPDAFPPFVVSQPAPPLDPW